MAKRLTLRGLVFGTELIEKYHLGLDLMKMENIPLTYLMLK